MLLPPYNVVKAITKSDSVNYDGTTYSASAAGKAIPADGLLIGDAGIVIAVLENGSTVRFTSLDGQIYPIRTIRINSTTTSATNMYALYSS